MECPNVPDLPKEWEICEPCVPILRNFTDCTYKNLDSETEVDYTKCTEDMYAYYRLEPRTILDEKYLIPITVVMVLIFVFGVIGNICVCVVIIRNRTIRTVTNMYLFNLAICDLMLLIFGLPYDLYYFWSRFPYVFGTITCKIIPFVIASVTWAAVLTVVAFSIERYIAVCHPYSGAMTGGKRLTVVFLLIWTISIACAIPQMLAQEVFMLDYPPGSGRKSHLTGKCMNTTKTDLTLYYELTSVILFFIPMVILVFAYLRIIMFIRSNRKFARNCGILQSNRHESSTTKILVAVVVMFFICWAPFHYQRITASLKNDEEEISRIKYVVTAIFYFISSAINPLVYSILSKRYRKAFLDVVGISVSGRKYATATVAGTAITYQNKETMSKRSANSY